MNEDKEYHNPTDEEMEQMCEFYSYRKSSLAKHVAEEWGVPFYDIPVSKRASWLGLPIDPLLSNTYLKETRLEPSPN